jgi:class 3 adenylate cyclase
MARFANDCLHKMHTLTRHFEVTLGPDTTDLTMRIGLHSGPITAGVYEEKGLASSSLGTLPTL